MNSRRKVEVREGELKDQKQQVKAGVVDIWRFPQSQQSPPRQFGWPWSSLCLSHAFSLRPSNRRRSDSSRQARDEHKHVSFLSYLPAAWPYLFISPPTQRWHETLGDKWAGVPIIAHSSTPLLACAPSSGALCFSFHLIFCSFICFTQFSFLLRTSLAVICKVMGWGLPHTVHKRLWEGKRQPRLSLAAGWNIWSFVLFFFPSYEFCRRAIYGTRVGLESRLPAVWFCFNG